LRFRPHGQRPAVEAEPTTVFLIAGAIRSAFPPSLDERDKLEWALEVNESEICVGGVLSGLDCCAETIVDRCLC
jgi:hypothetical protein